MGYSPLGSKDSTLTCEPEVMEIASYHRRTPQQLLLKWGLQNGWGVIPGSFNGEHIVANIDLDGWELGLDEMLRLSSMRKRERVYGDLGRMRLPIKVFLDERFDPPGPTFVGGV